MLTQAEIAAVEADSLTAEQAALLETYFRFWEGYNPSRYPALGTKLALYVPPTDPDPLDTAGVYRVKMLIATLAKLDAFGSKTIKIRNAAGVAMDEDFERNRNRVIEFALMVLYDRPPIASGMVSIPVIGRGAVPGNPALVPNQNTEGGWPRWCGDWWYFSLPPGLNS